MQITNTFQLVKLVKAKRSVVCPGDRCWKGPTPAAFMINQQGSTLHRLFVSGMYRYEKQSDQ